MSHHVRRASDRGALRLRALVLLVLGVAVLAVPGVAAAQDGGLRGSDVGADVTIGFGRGPSPNHWSLLEVTASPQVPIAGTVQVRSSGPLGGALGSADLEVAAGATKVVHVLVPPAEELQVAFRDRDGGRVPLEVRRSRVDDVLVGGYGDAPVLPDPLNSVGTDRAIRGVPVDPAVLSLGPRALEALDAFVISGAELAALPAAERDHLAVAAAQGLDLVVLAGPSDAEFGTPWEPLAGPADGDGLQAAPDAWRVTADAVGGDDDEVVAASVRAGRGRVIALGVTPGPDDDRAPLLMATLFQPRDDAGHPIAGADQGMELTRGLFGAGASLPGVLGTALFVLAFLVAVGPLNVLLLRRLGRRELGWVTVPLITVIFTVAAVGSAATRAPTSTPTLRASWWLDGVGQELDAVALQAASRETVSMALPGRRDVVTLDPWGSLAVTTRANDDRTEAQLSMQALQTATILSWGPSGGPPPLDVTATVEGGVLTAEITNASEHELTDLQLEFGTTWRRLDDLASGATTSVEVELDRLPRSRIADRFMGGMPDFPGAVPGGGADRDLAARRAIDLLRGGVLDESPGTVWVVGATRDRLDGVQPEVRGSVEDLGSAIAVGVTPVAGDTTLVSHQVQRGFLRSNTQGWRPGPTTLEGADRVEVRFRLPTPQAVGSLVSSLDDGGPLRGDVDGGWVDDPFGGGCFEVTVTTADGEQLEPEERCGNDIGCPPDSSDCTGEDDGVRSIARARLQDGSTQVAVRIPEEVVGGGELAGAEIWNVRTGGWQPASEVVTDGRGDYADLVSPFGEVLVRVRGAGFLDISQRGIGVAPPTDDADDGGDA